MNLASLSSDSTVKCSSIEYLVSSNIGTKNTRIVHTDISWFFFLWCSSRQVRLISEPLQMVFHCTCVMVFHTFPLLLLTHSFLILCVIQHRRLIPSVTVCTAKECDHIVTESFCFRSFNCFIRLKTHKFYLSLYPLGIHLMFYMSWLQNTGTSILWPSAIFVTWLPYVIPELDTYLYSTTFSIPPVVMKIETLQLGHLCIVSLLRSRTKDIPLVISGLVVLTCVLLTRVLQKVILPLGYPCYKYYCLTEFGLGLMTEHVDVTV